MERLNTARQAIARVGAKPALPALRVESSTDFAISIGAAFEAHIAGIAFADIVIVSNGRTKKDEVPGVEIGHHLARHAFEVEVRQLVAEDTDVADFMVMGGYGHSRLREFVVGGATRGILQTMTVPVLMAH